MKPPVGWRDQRTGRVFGFRSEAQRENFMAARARFSNGPNRQMPRCTAVNSWASRAGQRDQSSPHLGGLILTPGVWCNPARIASEPGGHQPCQFGRRWPLALATGRRPRATYASPYADMGRPAPVTGPRGRAAAARADVHPAPAGKPADPGAGQVNGTALLRPARRLQRDVSRTEGRPHPVQPQNLSARGSHTLALVSE